MTRKAEYIIDSFTAKKEERNAPLFLFIFILKLDSALPYTFGKQEFNLSVYRTEIVLCPLCDSIVKLG